MKNDIKNLGNHLTVIAFEIAQWDTDQKTTMLKALISTKEMQIAFGKDVLVSLQAASLAR